MFGIERRLERVAEAIRGRNAECTCDGAGSAIMVRYVAVDDPLEEPGEPGERRRRCLQHAPRIWYERFDRIRGEWVETDPTERTQEWPPD